MLWLPVHFSTMVVFSIIVTVNLALMIKHFFQVIDNPGLSASPLGRVVGHAVLSGLLIIGVAFVCANWQHLLLASDRQFVAIFLEFLHKYTLDPSLLEAQTSLASLRIEYAMPILNIAVSYYLLVRSTLWMLACWGRWHFLPFLVSRQDKIKALKEKIAWNMQFYNYDAALQSLESLLDADITDQQTYDTLHTALLERSRQNHGSVQALNDIHALEGLFKQRQSHADLSNAHKQVEVNLQYLCEFCVTPVAATLGDLQDKIVEAIGALQVEQQAMTSFVSAEAEFKVPGWNKPIAFQLSADYRMQQRRRALRIYAFGMKAICSHLYHSPVRCQSLLNQLFPDYLNFAEQLSEAERRANPVATLLEAQIYYYHGKLMLLCDLPECTINDRDLPGARIFQQGARLLGNRPANHQPGSDSGDLAGKGQRIQSASCGRDVVAAIGLAGRYPSHPPPPGRVAAPVDIGLLSRGGSDLVHDHRCRAGLQAVGPPDRRYHQAPVLPANQ